MAIPRSFQHPARLVPAAFLVLTVSSTLVLSLPVMTASGERPPFLTALFTATSATTVTGLVVEDTATYWSGAGHVAIMVICQVGGFGIMTLATLLAIGVSRRLGLRTRLIAAAETRSVGLGELRRVVLYVTKVVIVCETVVALVLAVRLSIVYGDVGRGVWHGIFHAVSAFNNAGFVIWETTEAFAEDWVVLLTLSVAVLGGSIGFPVLLELSRELAHPRTWSVHTQLTVYGSSLLVVLGTVMLLATEGGNTFGRFDPGLKLLNAFFASTQTRSGGFNAVDIGEMQQESWLVMDGLMFIGGGSAGTSGGIKVTTFLLLLFVIIAEVRGKRDVVVGRRRISTASQRLAVAIALLGVAGVAGGVFTLVRVSESRTDELIFEAISAFGTTGLSTGITATLEPAGHVALILLMLLGRVGIVTAASAFALASRPELYRLPEERPIVG